jgi:hypothetical protein
MVILIKVAKARGRYVRQEDYAKWVLQLRCYQSISLAFFNLSNPSGRTRPRGLLNL